MKALRQTVDLSAYPDLVVVYLGMTVNVLTGVKTLFGFGPKIEGSVAARPDGLLLHENLFYSLFPLPVGMRQYWRDLESLERFTRTGPHREWWKQFFARYGGNWLLARTLFFTGAVLKPSISTFSDRLAFSVLLRRYLQKEVYFRLVSDCTERGAADTPANNQADSNEKAPLLPKAWYQKRIAETTGCSDS
jgi:hypothetical protein